GDPRHEAARSWLDDVIAGPTPVALPWESLIAFLRVVTHPRLFDPPATTPDALQQVERWLASSNVWNPTPTSQHGRYLSELITEHDLAGNDIHDAHLAALAISHGLRVASHDAGFARFPAARWFDPLAN
ncbi:MAG: TA system VapC family ribonuclease toxin, partial [Pseudolysinimonas sp.]